MDLNGVSQSPSQSSLLIEHSSKKDSLNILSNHYHPDYELDFLISGERYFFVNYRTYHLLPGDVLCVNKNIPHKPVGGVFDAHDRIKIKFDESYLKDFHSGIQDIDLFSLFRSPICVLRLDQESKHFVMGHLHKMMDEHCQDYPGSNTTCKLLLITLLIFLNRYADTAAALPSQYPSCLHEKISRISRYIYDHYKEHLTLTSVAGNFSLNPYYFSRVFKEVTGFTFIEYLHTLRNIEVEQLLSESELKVSEISEKVGYENITHLERVFKSINGCCPTQFRKVSKS